MTIGTFVNLPHYQITEQLHESDRTLVYRGRDLANERPVVIKLMRHEYPSFRELVQFRNQYAIAKNLDIEGILKSYALERYENRYALILEDMGGISLAEYKGSSSLSIPQFLALALQLAEILHQLHNHSIIHKDIKPANLLIHPETQEIKLIDFSISSLLPRETQTLQTPNVLEGTLAYLSPEQTGRMNRGIDYRSDFYSLGVTFYELLTGTLPFRSDDPMELLHCHIAKAPTFPHTQHPIPKILSDIVLKLMAKNSEDRYQNALGLKYDLENCLAQYRETETIEPFVLGERDICDRFLIPEKLYGRDAEVQMLLDVFERVALGSSELMLVAGFSGIGKTAAIEEVHKPIVRQRGYFIKGKFDQFNRNIPFSAFVQAFRDLVGQLLSENDAELQTWKTQILDALGDNAQVIIDLIPELENILGPQPPAPELSGTAAQNRFNRLFHKFVQVFTTPEHPLVIFVDDLQWADSASLNLMQVLMAESKTGHLLLLGAYRDNEVFPAHSLMLTLDRMGRQETKIHTLTLGPLSEENINQLVADTLLCSGEIAAPLSQLIYQKTKGNPFFSTQFLQGLYQDEYIFFNVKSGYWQCDFTQVRQASLTDDVVGFMVGRLQTLPSSTQEILKIASCIGNHFELETLAVACDRPQDEIAIDLWSSLQAGLVVPENETYKFFQGSWLDEEIVDDINISYRFLHDRVQQAAYALIPEVKKQITHVQIGELLLANLSVDRQGEKVFEIVNHLNKGIELYQTPAKRSELLRLNCIAGKRAKAATAYGASVSYLEIAQQLLPPNSWQQCYEESLDIHLHLAESQYLSGNFQSSLALVETIASIARHPVEQAEALNLAVIQCTLQGDFLGSVQYGQRGLACLGFDLSETNLEEKIKFCQDDIDAKLATRKAEQLSHGPEATDPEKRTTLKILNNLIVPTYVLQKGNLFCLVTLSMVSVSLNFGLVAESGNGFATYGMFLGGHREDYQAGYEFGVIGQEITKRFNQGNELCKVCYILANNLLSWVQPLRNSAPIFREGLVAGLDSGELVFSGNIMMYQPLNPFYAGESIADIHKDLPKYLEFAAKTLNYQLPIDVMTGLNIWLTDLLEEDNKDIPTEAEYIAQCESNNSTYAICHYWILKTKIFCLYGHYEEALIAAQDAEDIISVITGKYQVGALNFYQSMATIEYLRSHSSEPDNSYLKKLESNQAKLKKWAEGCSENFAHKYYLVDASLSSFLGNKLQAIDSFDLAIAGAKENSYLQEEALANELVAKFYLDWGKEKYAALHMQEAYYCYAQWGAKAKTDDLEQRYPQLLKPILRQDRSSLSSNTSISKITSHFHTQTATIANISDLLDFSSLLKASQTLSGEIELDRLLSTLMEIILENAGATKGALLLVGKEGLTVETIATRNGETLHLSRESRPLEESRELPAGLINYVRRTTETALLDAKTAQMQFATDNYLLCFSPQSLLCMPLLERGNLTGILYLENALTADAFTHDRIELLDALCAQAAISLTNARLYQKAQQALQDLQTAQLQLVQNEKMATLGNLVAGVAHEINNPVSFIRGNVGVAQEYLQDLLDALSLYAENTTPPESVVEEIEDLDLEFISEDFPKLIASMQTGCDRIRNISTSLRTFSRTDTKVKTGFNLHEGLDSTLLILKYRLKANERRPAIEIVKQYGELPEVKCYAGQINQVFMNLVANAIDALDESNEGKTFAQIEKAPNRITIATEFVPSENSVIVSIADNGTGMPEEVRAKIFEQGFTTKEVGKGTGLGLTIAHQIIAEKHGGTLTCHSELGKGTAFVIKIPLQA